MTREQVVRAMDTGATAQMLYRWEHGHHKPSPKHLERLAAALQTDVATFFVMEGDKAQTPDPFQRAPAGQLDRIEAKLDAVLAALGATPTADALADFLRALPGPNPQAGEGEQPLGETEEGQDDPETGTRGVQ